VPSCLKVKMPLNVIAQWQRQKHTTKTEARNCMTSPLDHNNGTAEKKRASEASTAVFNSLVLYLISSFGSEWETWLYDNAESTHTADERRDDRVSGQNSLSLTMRISWHLNSANFAALPVSERRDAGGRARSKYISIANRRTRSARRVISSNKWPLDLIRSHSFMA
jgi:hypothetical protein